jgi:nicotinamidase-related amidase
LNIMVKTLLQMAGVEPQPAALAKAAVIVIDAQREYVDGRLPLAGMDTALLRLERLLARAREAGTPIIHIAHKGRPGGLFDRDAPGGAFAGPATPRSGEIVIEKPLPNAFAKTGLEEALRATGREAAIIAGFMTHMCVSSTARAALDLGFPVTIAADATATRDLPDPLGGVVPADAVQRAALAELGDRFACIAPVDMIPAV